MKRFSFFYRKDDSARHVCLPNEKAVLTNVAIFGLDDLVKRRGLILKRVSERALIAA